MRKRTIRAIARRALGAPWVAVLAFLASAHPAHAAVPSGRGALLLQLGVAGLLGSLFAFRKVLLRRRGLAGDLVARAVHPRAAGAEALADGRAPVGSGAAVAGTAPSGAAPAWVLAGPATRSGSAAVPAGTGLQAEASVPHPPSPPSPLSTP